LFYKFHTDDDYLKSGRFFGPALRALAASLLRRPGVEVDSLAFMRNA
jgi:hypothetical protein